MILHRSSTGGRVEAVTRDHIAIVTLRHPEVRNAMTIPMWRELARVVAALDADPDVRAIVLRGYGMDFSSGADIRDLPTDPADFHRVHVATEHVIAETLTPVIAAVSGDCVGGGCEIAVAADLRFADTTARFGVTASRLGIVYPEAPTRRLEALVGVAETRRMLLGGELLDVWWAREAGLVNEVVPEGEAFSRALDFARLLTGRSPATIDGAQRITRGRAVTAGREPRHYREGRRAFVERRSPDFRHCD
ncbi:MAG: enoyl-CoA hydratase/isomerase family protein [Aeromicrobium sp.]|uniref:enoyl-CoA hydratase/isomerase family protein n=1 Tax=Aeromicrobium sp. TaxID=1871063 RepID=UPI0039E21C61